jgi:hypothetical protein
VEGHEAEGAVPEDGTGPFLETRRIDGEEIMKKNKSNIIDRDRKAIAGIQKHYANAPALVLNGVSYTPAEVEKVLQDQIDTADATGAAKVGFHKAVAAERAAGTTANGVFLALKSKVFNDFKTNPDAVGDFGLALPARRQPSPDKVVEAVKKREATREARHTMGPKKKAEIKGILPASPATTKA